MEINNTTLGSNAISNAAGAPGARQYRGLDIFRTIAAFMVIAIHTAPFSVWSETAPFSVWSESADFVISYCVCRIAVPFFLMVTGYFTIAPYISACRTGSEEERASAGRSITGFVKKCLLIYAAATLLYLPLNIYSGNLPHTATGMIKDILMDGTFYHLWYFPAVIVGALLITAVTRLHVKPRVMLAGASLLYIFGVFGDSWYGASEKIDVIKHIYDGVFAVSSYTRNGLFFAPLFLLLGVLCAEIKVPASLCRAGMRVCFPMMLIEGFITYFAGWQRHNSMYLMLPIVMFILFQLLLGVKGEGNATVRRWTTLIYVIHPAVLVCVRGAAGAAGLTNIFVENTFMEFITVSMLSLTASAAADITWRRLRQVFKLGSKEKLKGEDDHVSEGTSMDRDR